MRIINLAQTAFYLLGAYVGLTLVAHGMNFWLASVAGGVVTMVLGLAVYSAFLHRYHADPLTSLLLTLGFALILDDGDAAPCGAATRTRSRRRRCSPARCRSVRSCSPRTGSR